MEDNYEHTYTWGKTRDRAISLFNDAPGATVENRVLIVFERHPAMVETAVDYVSDRYHQGKIRSPWGFLATHVEKTAVRLDNPQVLTVDGDRSQKVRRAEEWMLIAGHQLPSLTELDEELFGRSGRLEPYRQDQTLRDRFARLWTALQEEETA